MTSVIVDTFKFNKNMPGIHNHTRLGLILSYLLLSCFPTGKALWPSEGRQSLTHQNPSDASPAHPNTPHSDSFVLSS